MTIPSENCPSYFLCSTAGCCGGPCHSDGDTPSSSIRNRVYRVVADQAGHPADLLTDDSKLVETLRMDSLDLVELVMALEDEFNLNIPDEACSEFGNPGTVGKIVELLQARHAQWTPPPKLVSALAPVLAHAAQLSREVAGDLSGNAAYGAMSHLLLSWSAADSCQDPMFSQAAMLADIDKVINKLTTLKAHIASGTTLD